MSNPPSLAERLSAEGIRIDGDSLVMPATAERGLMQLRVIETRVFARVQTDGRWTEADWRELSAQQLMEFYADESPVATWLRENQVDVLGAALAAMVWPR